VTDFRPLVDEQDCHVLEYADWISNIRRTADRDPVTKARLATIDIMEARLATKREIARVLRVGLERQMAREASSSPEPPCAAPIPPIAEQPSA
jgi:hypothetical protein